MCPLDGLWQGECRAGENMFLGENMCPQ